MQALLTEYIYYHNDSSNLATNAFEMDVTLFPWLVEPHHRTNCPPCCADYLKRKMVASVC